MAVQKSKPTRSKRGMRRSHDKIKLPSIFMDKSSKKFHLYHYIDKEEYKNKKQVFLKRKKNDLLLNKK